MTVPEDSRSFRFESVLPLVFADAPRGAYRCTRQVRPSDLLQAYFGCGVP